MDKKIFDFINRYLDNETYEIPVVDDFITVKVKLKLTGEKQMISVGKWTDYLTYSATIFLDDEGNRTDDLAEKLMFKGQTHIEFKSYELTHIYFYFSRKCNQVLTSVLDLFNVDKEVIMTELIKGTNNEIIDESIIREGRFDRATRDTIKDIIQIVKNHDEGEFSLPEELPGGEMTYDFGGSLRDFSITLELVEDETIDGYEVDAEYYREDETIVIQIIINPESKQKILQDLIGDLNELLRHEFEHMKQNYMGYEFPEEPENPFDYYTNKHEIEAQLAGFKRRSKKEKRNLEDIIRNWFEKNKKRHKLTDKEVERVIEILLNY